MRNTWNKEASQQLTSSFTAVKQDPAVSKYQTWIETEFSTAFGWVNGVSSERHGSQKQKIYPRKGNRAAKAALCLKNGQEDDYAIGLDREDESSSSTPVARRPLQPKRQYTGDRSTVIVQAGENWCYRT